MGADPREARKTRAAEMVHAGFTTPEIAARLGLARRTVDVYRSELAAEGRIGRYQNHNRDRREAKT